MWYPHHNDLGVRATAIIHATNDSVKGNVSTVISINMTSFAVFCTFYVERYPHTNIPKNQHAVIVWGGGYVVSICLCLCFFVPMCLYVFF